MRVNIVDDKTIVFLNKFNINEKVAAISIPQSVKSPLYPRRKAEKYIRPEFRAPIFFPRKNLQCGNLARYQALRHIFLQGPDKMHQWCKSWLSQDV